MPVSKINSLPFDKTKPALISRFYSRVSVHHVDTTQHWAMLAWVKVYVIEWQFAVETNKVRVLVTENESETYQAVVWKFDDEADLSQGRAVSDK